MLISIIVPTHNEASNMKWLVQEYKKLCFDLQPITFELLIIDDGDDNLLQEVIPIADDEYTVKVLSLSRRFSQGAAIVAGLSECIGDCAIIMDADGQDDPRLIKHLIEKWESTGADVVAVKRESEEKSKTYSLGSKMFYKLLENAVGSKTATGTGEFRLISRFVIDFVSNSRDFDPFLRGLSIWPTSKVETIEAAQLIPEYTGRAQRLSGQSNYNYRKSAVTAIQTLISFTTAPLRSMTYLATVLMLSLPLITLYAVTMRILTTQWVPGVVLFMGVTFFLFGIVILMLATLGEYVQVVYRFVQGRPVYLVASTWTNKRIES